MIIPDGKATTTARRSTNRVLSKSDLTSICPICGRRYGGSSSAKDDGTPFKRVTDKSLEAVNDAKTEITTNKERKTAETAFAEPVPAKNIHMRHIKNGKRPLHGRNELDIIAISLFAIFFFLVLANVHKCDSASNYP